MLFSQFRKRNGDLFLLGNWRKQILLEYFVRDLFLHPYMVQYILQDGIVDSLKSSVATTQHSEYESVKVVKRKTSKRETVEWESSPHDDTRAGELSKVTSHF
jgi:hypothetical protein